MNKRVIGIVLTLVFLLFAFLTSAANPIFVEVDKNSEIGVSNLANSGSEAVSLAENMVLKAVLRSTRGPIKNQANDHYYQLVEVIGSSLNWYEARAAAASMEYRGIPGHLATLTSQQEEEFIVNNFPEIYPEYVWLGASDEANEGYWQWITGEAWDYTDWALEEPNGGTYENCLDYGDYSAQWNDENCDRKLNFYLVEYSQTPITISIDIKSGIEPNNLYCQWGELVRRGIFDVAILTTESFDATTVDHTTVTFEGAKEIHFDWRTGGLRRHEIDVDRDGDIDLLFHFRLGDTDLKCNSTEGTLIGETFDGIAIQGTDSVRMVNYNPPRPSPPPYYAALPHPPNSAQATLTFGLLTFGFLFGAGLVVGLPSRLKNRK
jgi:hypothetical protein